MSGAGTMSSGKNLLKINLFLIDFKCMCTSILFACVVVYHVCVPGGLRGKRREWDLLELELHMVVNCHVDTGN